MGKVRQDLEFEINGVAKTASTGPKDLGPALARVRCCSILNWPSSHFLLISIQVKGAGEVPLCVLVAEGLSAGDLVLKVRVKSSAGSKHLMIAQIAWW
jgi:hypothetical protein